MRSDVVPPGVMVAAAPGAPPPAGHPVTTWPTEGQVMLVLTRKSGEQVVLNHGEVVITVVAVRGNRVRLGIQAPPEVLVDRTEVHARRAEFADNPLLVASDG